MMTPIRAFLALVDMGSDLEDPFEVYRRKRLAVLTCVAVTIATMLAGILQFIVPSASYPNFSQSVASCFLTAIASACIIVVYVWSKNEKLTTILVVSLIVGGCVTNQIFWGSSVLPWYVWLGVASCISVLNGLHGIVTIGILLLTCLSGVFTIVIETTGFYPQTVLNTAQEPGWLFVVCHHISTVGGLAVMLQLMHMEHKEVIEGQKIFDEELLIIGDFQAILDRMYPKSIQEELLGSTNDVTIKVKALSCSFIDLHNFTAFTKRAGVSKTLQFIGYLFSSLDTISDYFGVLKLKTIGDCYMSIAGLEEIPLHPIAKGSPAAAQLYYLTCVMQLFSSSCSFEDSVTEELISWVNQQFKVLNVNDPRRQSQVLELINEDSSLTPVSSYHPTPLQPQRSEVTTYQIRFRAGVATGDCDLIVLQGKVPQLDTWGDVINTASRLESGSVPGFIQLDKEAMKSIHNSTMRQFDFSGRRMVAAKGLGRVPAYIAVSTRFIMPPNLQDKLSIKIKTGPAFRFEASADVKPSEVPESSAPGQSLCVLPSSTGLQSEPTGLPDV